MAESFVDVSDFELKELTGKKRTVKLRGRGLPLRGVDMGTEQRVEPTWLVGAPVGTLTTLGRKVPPISVHGFWKDKFLGADLNPDSACISLGSTTVATVRDARVLFESLVESAQRVRITWFDIVRVGIITKFTPKHHNLHDMEWTLDFECESKGEPTAPSVFITDNDIATVSNTLKDKFTSLSDVKLPQVPLNGDFLAGIKAIFSTIDDAIFAVESAASQLANVLLTPNNAIRLIAAETVNIQNQCKRLENRFNEFKAEFVNIANVADQSPGERIEEQLWQREMIMQSRALKASAAEQLKSLLGQIFKDIEAEYIAKANEDLRDVSLKFYGNAYEWRRIMVFNQLDGAELFPGQHILVPRVNPAEVVGAS